MGWSNASQLIVLDIDAKGAAPRLLIVFPMIVNAILHKFEVCIKERFGLGDTRRNNAANWQAAAEIVPVSRCWAWRQNLTKHGDLLVGIENLAQYIGAAPLSADHHKEMTFPAS